MIKIIYYKRYNILRMELINSEDWKQRLQGYKELSDSFKNEDDEAKVDFYKS